MTFFVEQKRQETIENMFKDMNEKQPILVYEFRCSLGKERKIPASWNCVTK